MVPGSTATRPKILLVDDEEDALFFATTAIERSGFDVELIAVRTAGEAVRTLEQRPLPAVVMLDLGLPGEPGEELLQSIREKYTPAELPILLLTGLKDPRRIEEAERLGISGCIEKSVGLPDFLNAMRMALAALLGSPERGGSTPST